MINSKLIDRKNKSLCGGELMGRAAVIRLIKIPPNDVEGRGSRGEAKIRLVPVFMHDKEFKKRDTSSDDI